MKKFLSILLVAMLAVSMSVSAFAAPNNFISSPGKNNAPSLDYKNESEDCVASLAVISWNDRNSMTEEEKVVFEKAYDEIVSSTDLTAMVSGLDKMIADKKLTSKDVAVGDLFDISCKDCASHESHGAFTITLSEAELENFVALIHFNGTEWEIVEGAKVSADKKSLTFVYDDFSPFAIISKTSSNAEQTGEEFPWAIVVAVVAAAGLVVLCLTAGKKKTTDK